MGTEQRRHERYATRLVVRYNKAAEFVVQYTENLSIGGVFVAGARDIELLQEIDVEIELPGQPTWRVRAKAVFVVDEATAATQGRVAGVGMEITRKPPGFEDALLGYLLRLGRRRDFAVMVGGVPGADRIADAGYRTLPLEDVSTFVNALVNASVPIIGVVVPPSSFAVYEALARTNGAGDIVFVASSVDDVVDIVARIDSLL